MSESVKSLSRGLVTDSQPNGARADDAVKLIKRIGN